MKEVEAQFKQHLLDENPPIDEELVSSPLFESITDDLQEVLISGVDPDKAYDPNKIYDTLSCDAFEKFQNQEMDKYAKRKQIEEQRKIDEETFGPQSGPPIDPSKASGMFIPQQRLPINTNRPPQSNQGRSDLPPRPGTNRPVPSNAQRPSSNYSNSNYSNSNYSNNGTYRNNLNNMGNQQRPNNPNVQRYSYPNAGSGPRFNNNSNIANTQRPNNPNGQRYSNPNVGQRSNQNPNVGGQRSNPNFVPNNQPNGQGQKFNPTVQRSNVYQRVK